MSIDDQLLDAAKKRASQRGVTLGAYVEDALRLQLSQSDKPAGPAIPVFTRGTGMRGDIDSASNRSLFDALDASEDPA